MLTRSVVLYRGRDAEVAAAAWNDGDRRFAVDGMGTDTPVEGVHDRERLDCVVYRVPDGVDPEPFLAAVRERSNALPVIVVSGEGPDDPAAILAHDPTHHLVVDEDDALALLETLSATIERAIDHRLERSMLDSLMENIPLSVYFKNRRSRHVRVSDDMLSMIGPSYVENPEGKRHHHHHPEAVAGKSDYDLYPASLAEETMEDDRTVMESEEPIEDRVEHSYGEPGTGTYVATSKAPWYDEDGNVIGLLGVTRDISERKGYEYHLERQNERLERFATMVSHDIRNPLSVALGRLEPARETGEAEHFEAIERSMERIESIIEDVLMITRHAESVLDPSPVDLGAVARDAWGVVETGGATRSVDVDAAVLADRSRLRQLFENLFANAVTHATDDEDGPDDLTITIGELPGGEGFYVADDGVGIPPEKRDAILEAGISEAESTGLGLSIVLSIANAHNWRLEVGDSDDGGARFEFWGVRRPPGGEAAPVDG